MPTKAEVEELKAKCEFEATDSKGMRGYRIVGQNGNCMFLPALGFKKDSLRPLDKKWVASYWSVTRTDKDSTAYGLNLAKDKKLRIWGRRRSGSLIRGVHEK